MLNLQEYLSDDSIRSIPTCLSLSLLELLACFFHSIYCNLYNSVSKVAQCLQSLVCSLLYIHCQSHSWNVVIKTHVLCFAMAVSCFPSPRASSTNKSRLSQYFLNLCTVLSSWVHEINSTTVKANNNNSKTGIAKETTRNIEIIITLLSQQVLRVSFIL